MPQGFKNSPSIFQKAMNIILEELIGKTCISYMDDVLIFGKDIKEHDKNFQDVQKRLCAYRMIENYEKRIFRNVKGCKKKVLEKVVEMYNKTFHKGIKMMPLEAVKEENWKRVREAVKTYQEEFVRKERRYDRFKVGNIVMLRNENRKDKMEEYFKQKGRVVEDYGNDCYKVRLINGKEFKRHALQFKLLEEGDVGCKPLSVLNQRKLESD
jgi:hypothetical protein